MESKESTRNPVHLGKNFRKKTFLSSIADPNGKNLSNDILRGSGYTNPSYLWKISKTRKKNLASNLNDKSMSVMPTGYVTTYPGYFAPPRATSCSDDSGSLVEVGHVNHQIIEVF